MSLSDYRMERGEREKKRKRDKIDNTITVLLFVKVMNLGPTNSPRVLSALSGFVFISFLSLSFSFFFKRMTITGRPREIQFMRSAPVTGNISVMGTQAYG